MQTSCSQPQRRSGSRPNIPFAKDFKWTDDDPTRDSEIAIWSVLAYFLANLNKGSIYWYNTPPNISTNPARDWANEID